MTASKTETELIYAMKIKFQIGNMTYPGYLFQQRIRYGNETIDLCGIEVNKDNFGELKAAVERRDPGIVPLCEADTDNPERRP